jgi:ketol-acid reductoisomerase
MLIADQAQKSVYENGLHENMKSGAMLVTAHGYSITFGGMEPRDDLDVTMLAPRFPGQVIRENYQNGKGTLAFFDSYKDITGTGKQRGLALAKSIGLTNLLQVGLEEETHADLFIENFLIPRLRGTIEACYNTLVGNGISKEVAALESYQSGEILGLLVDGIGEEGIEGLYHSFHSRTSPTCQFGVSEGDPKVNANAMEVGGEIYNGIVNGEFSEKLAAEEEKGYPQKNAFNQKNLDSDLNKALEELRE